MRGSDEPRWWRSAPSRRVTAPIRALAISTILIAACSSTTQRAATGPGDTSSWEAADDIGEIDHDDTTSPLASVPGSADEPGPSSGSSSQRRDEAPGGPRRQDVPRSDTTESPSPPTRTGGSIQIGIEYTESDPRAAFGASGGGGEGPAAAQAIVDYINAHGGMAGREVVPIFHGTDANVGSYAAQAQATCASFTEDNQVFAAVSNHVGIVAQELLACLAKRGTPLVSQLFYPWDQTLFDQYDPFLFDPNFLNASRWGVWIDGLQRQGFFSPNARVGIVTFDTALYARIVERTIEPALEAHRISVVERADLKEAESTAAIGGLTTEINSALLRFRSSNVSHVLFVGTQGLVEFFWMPAAESQSYRPRYGLNSFEKPYFLASNVPPGQLGGALGVGWQPQRDVDAEQDPGGRPGYTLCSSLFSDAGITAEDRNAEAYNMAYCDALLFLKAALDRVDQVTPAAFAQAVEQLGDSYMSPLAFATRFGPGRHDGASAVRAFAFDKSCGCFVYTTPLERVP